jgi:uncharacterized protein involved in outer membrane biogenesis
VSNLGVGIPFLSSLPHDAEIRVTPRLEGMLDGAHFAFAGTTSTPFVDRKEATLEINVDSLMLPGYVEYAPLPNGLKLKDGALTTRLALAFVSEKGEPRTLTLSGTARLDRLAITRADGSALAGARSIDVTLAKLDPLGRMVALQRVAVESPDSDLRRGKDGVLEFEHLLSTETKPGTGAAAAPRPTDASWTYSVAELHVADGTARIADDAVSPEFHVALSKISLDARNLASSGGAGAVEAAFDSEEGAHFGATANVDVAKGAARGHLSLRKFPLAKLYPYYVDALNLDVRRGELDFAGDFDTAQSGASPQLTLAQGAATLADLDLGVRGEKDSLWRVPRTDVDGIAFDLARHTVTIDRVEARPVSLRVVRQADGVVNFERLFPASKPASTAQNAGAQGGAGWNVVVRKLLFDRMAADFEDRVPQPPVKLRVSEARIAAENFGNVHGAKGTIDFTARIGSGGRMRAAGSLVAQPLAIDWRVDANGIDLAPLRPYFESQTNVFVTGGSVTAKGRVTYAGTSLAGPTAGFAGDVAVNDFGALDRPTSQELVRWKSLTLSGVDVSTAPRKVALGAIALDQFYARVIINPDATLNLQRLLSPEASGGQTPPPTPATEHASEELPVSIGRVQLSQGEVQFSDFYIKPNYSAHLTSVSGSVSALSATQAGDVQIDARVEDTAPVEIRGTLNPFARDLALDLNAKATDIDLPPLTTYSAKYAGYGITKGTLSFEVRYKIDQRKLAATNKLVLDQLTFGERVESPTATKLPVLLAVALLKDRNGVIHLDLPIQGTLDDPKFSVWGVIVQIVVNLITKAVTAPFALLGSLAGSHGEELAFIEFEPGRAQLTVPAQAKLQSLAKALADRPGLKLDAAGRAIPDLDRDGLKRVALDRAMRTQKQKAMVSEGASAPPLDALTIDATEYPRYLAAVYRDTQLTDKPRNLIGMAKDIPPAEMEALLLASYGVDDDALRTLANRRAQTVKEWFVEKGGIASERVFVVAPKLSGGGIQDKGVPTRVDFAIR